MFHFAISFKPNMLQTQQNTKSRVLPDIQVVKCHWWRTHKQNVFGCFLGVFFYFLHHCLMSSATHEQQSDPGNQTLAPLGISSHRPWWFPCGRSVGIKIHGLFCPVLQISGLSLAKPLLLWLIQWCQSLANQWSALTQPSSAHLENGISWKTQRKGRASK